MLPSLGSEHRSHGGGSTVRSQNANTSGKQIITTTNNYEILELDSGKICNSTSTATFLGALEWFSRD